MLNRKIRLLYSEVFCSTKNVDAFCDLHADSRTLVLISSQLNKGYLMLPILLCCPMKIEKIRR